MTSRSGMLRCQDSMICDSPQLLRDLVASAGMGAQLPGGQEGLGSGLAELEVPYSPWDRDGCCPLGPLHQPEEREVGLLSSPLPLCNAFCHQSVSVPQDTQSPLPQTRYACPDSLRLTLP